MALIQTKRELPIGAAFKTITNSSAASVSKLLFFANSTIFNSAVTVISNSRISLPDRALYEFSLTMEGISGGSIQMRFQYGINGVFTTMTTSTANTDASGKFEIILKLNANDYVEFRIEAVTGTITQANCYTTAGTTFHTDTITVIKL